ncbi:uncharacterized protein LOC116423936 isoform X2 [Nomia melanderi]|uniref:uncharacterized protein LOC116423936 isoform X2 n=1 Tax=Nomia melanderi TaxID=2448451 RepID=UPI001303F835|nr:FAST kinase domain-containing protein 2, mitochondrial-like isoform X2 [Nomia melanderi]
MLPIGILSMKINMINKFVLRLNKSLKIHQHVKLLNYSAMYCISQQYKESEEVTSGFRYARKQIYNSQVNNRPVSEILKRMYEFSELMHNESVVNSKQFLRLCIMIQYNVRSLSIQNIFDVLDFLYSLKVPTNTVLVETLLQLLRVQINTLTLSQIRRLYHKLKRLDETELIKGLLFALPIVFENRIKIELDERNKNNIIQALNFATQVKNMNLVIYAINKLYKNNETKNIYDAVTILHGLILIPELNILDCKLLNQMTDIIINNYETLNFEAIRFLLVHIEKRHKNKQMKNSYFENLVHTLYHVMKNKNMSFDNDIEVLRLLNRIKYRNISFMDYLAQKCVENPNLLRDCTAGQMNSFIKAMTISSYKTTYWEKLEPLILDFVWKCDFDLAVLITFYLLSLDYYNEKLLKHVFSSRFCSESNLLDVGIMSFLIRLYQCVKILYPNYQGITLSQNVIDHCIQKTTVHYNSFLKTCLEDMVGGGTFVGSNMTTKFGHHIDHIIILNPNGFPVVIQYDNSRYIENITAPLEYSRILILSVPTSVICKNSGRYHSTWEICVKSLEKLTGYTIVQISADTWWRLPNNEKKSYLLKLLPNLKVQ